MLDDDSYLISTTRYKLKCTHVRINSGGAGEIPLTNNRELLQLQFFGMKVLDTFI